MPTGNLTLQSTLPLPAHPSSPKTPLHIPILGFGVWASPRNLTVASVQHALKSGYRHIDTAQYYDNETEVGKAVRECGLKREDVWITTKILSPGKVKDGTYEKAKRSLGKMWGADEKGFVDLFLVHWPNPGAKARKEMYTALERLYDEGRARSIGVSNFGIGHIEEMKSWAKVWPPHVNQIELHPWCQQREIVKYCQEHNILIQAYSPIVRNQKKDDPILNAIAKAHNVSTTQVLIRYSLQKGWMPLPKSDNPTRIEQNADVYGFELKNEEMEKLDSLDTGDGSGAIVQFVDNSSSAHL